MTRIIAPSADRRLRRHSGGMRREPSSSPVASRALRRGLWLGLVVVLAAAAGAASVWAFSGARLVADGAALGRVELQPFAGSLVGVHAEGPDGQSIPLVVSHGLLTPRTPVAPGERI